MNLLSVLMLCMLPDSGGLTLDACYADALRHHPLQAQTAYYEQILSSTLSNLNVRYLPEMNLSLQASYQSRVMKIPLTVPGVELPSPLKDAYQFSFTVNQMIWDFGQTGAQKETEKMQNRLDQQSLRVELYKIRQAVADAFFTLLILQAKNQSLFLVQTDIQNRLNDLRAKVTSGTVLPGNVDILEAERIKILQQMTENQSAIKTARRTLGELIGRPLNENEHLYLPDTLTTNTGHNDRPEYDYFQASSDLYGQMIQLNYTKYRPRVYAFAQWAYARPGLNYFNRSFQDYYIVGIKAGWNIWNWNTSQRETAILKYRQKMIDAQKAWFTKNQNLALIRLEGEIEKLDALMENDRPLIELRERITRQAASQLQNGVITATEYLSELHAEHQARLTLNIHRIQRMQAVANYRIIRGE